jgi:hypothetical protein
MSKILDEQRDAIVQKIRDSLYKAEVHVNKLRSTNSRFIYISLISSALGTAVAGLAAVFGPLAGQGPNSWRITCAVVAVFTACATIFSGLHKQLTISDRLAKATACVGKLKALEVAITVTNRDLVEVVKEYEEVIGSYPDFIF